MAPNAPTKRKPLRLKATERLTNPLLPRKVHRPDSAVTDAFLPSKADKRLIKHSSFVSRITKPAAAASSSSSSARKNAKRSHARRRRCKDAAAQGPELVGQPPPSSSSSSQSLATLDALAAALPELTADELRAGAAERAGRVRHRSLGSKRGALKRRERVVRHEMERFGLSLAQLQAVQEEQTAAAEPQQQQQQREQQQQQQQRTLRGTWDAKHADVKMDGVEAPAAPSSAANRFAALRGFIAATMEQNPAFALQK